MKKQMDEILKRTGKVYRESSMECTLGHWEVLNLWYELPHPIPVYSEDGVPNIDGVPVVMENVARAEFDENLKTKLREELLAVMENGRTQVSTADIKIDHGVVKSYKILYATPEIEVMDEDGKVELIKFPEKIQSPGIFETFDSIVI